MSKAKLEAIKRLARLQLKPTTSLITALSLGRFSAALAFSGELTSRENEQFVAWMTRHVESLGGKKARRKKTTRRKKTVRRKKTTRRQSRR